MKMILINYFRGSWKSQRNRANRRRVRQNRRRAGARRRIQTRARGGGRNRSPRRRRNDPCSEDPSGAVTSKGDLSFPPSKCVFRLDIRVKNTRTSTTQIYGLPPIACLQLIVNKSFAVAARFISEWSLTCVNL